MDDRRELIEFGRLLLEDVCSDVVRFRHTGDDPARYGTVRIDREVALGPPGAFADLLVEPRDAAPYFVEVKYGYDAATLVAHLRRKYGALPASTGVHRLVLVVETAAHADWPAVEAAAREVIAPHLTLEVWDEALLREMIAGCFGRTIPSFAPHHLVSIRAEIDQGKERLAFGETLPGGYAETAVRQNLLWRFGTWRLRELRLTRERLHAGAVGDPANLVPPGVYHEVVVLLADLSGFSRWVRDTPDEAVVRQSLTSFYAKARYQIINAGGMLDQFVGDQVVALFGIPDRRAGYVDDALRTAFRLLDIAESVCHNWQRRIDHVQTQRGVHIGMAMGRVQLVSMRALDHSRLAVIGECINIAARLQGIAGQGEIVASNVLRHALQATPHELVELDPFDAHNLGTLRPWQVRPPRASGHAPLPLVSGPAYADAARD